MSPTTRKLTVSSARRAAFDILSRVDSGRAYAAELIAALFPEEGLSREDRALTQEITLGVLRWQSSLDHLIERYSSRPIGRIDPPVVIALRMGLYQLRHLTRVPASAAVNESVQLVKTAGVGSAAGFANAVLRKAARHPTDEVGADIANPDTRFALEVSHPDWLLRRWLVNLGENETRALALANNKSPNNSFRVNTLRTSVGEALAELSRAGVNARASGLVPGAFVVEKGISAVQEATQRGLVYLQDEASQLVSLLIQAQPGDRVLDLCAAPGSKATHIAALTQGEAWIVASDAHHHRLESLVRTSRRLGVHSIDPVVLDATYTLPFADNAPRFDRVLIDAPCSGTGTLRRNPEIKWRLLPEDISRLARLQLDLLVAGSTVVKPGGRLVYSTCSLEREENEEAVTRFLDRNPQFSPVEPDAVELMTSEGFVRTFPHRHRMDGFFAAVLERRSGKTGVG